MGKMDGISITDYLFDHYPEIKVIGLSTYTEQNIVEDMLSAGAWGYLTKINLDLLGEAILSVFKGQVYIDPLILVDEVKREFLMCQRKEQKAVRYKLGITKREATFLTLNATGLEYSEIANLMFVERKTVENIFSNLAKKVGVKNRQNLTLFSIRNSLVKMARFNKYESEN